MTSTTIFIIFSTNNAKRLYHLFSFVYYPDSVTQNDTPISEFYII
ncbi:25912_t:CDS:2 [Dentiscutata erythropus]|uniref:25912_t:CDS:1 n=1 Tax=Dentiscutata erythropus TaxID=1348616 RepID=A0A9N8YVD6_9GLOM|nr:25912_t:CDS:2 [Dentiscutata erythropus]